MAGYTAAPMLLSSLDGARFDRHQRRRLRYRGPVTRAAALGVAYAAITAVVVSPLIDYRHLATASYEGDARLLIWTLAWDAHALLRGTPLFEANIYYPEPRALAFAEHHIGIGLPAAPVYAATANPVVTYWMIWLLAFPLNALAMYALAWRVTRDRPGAFVAGCVYAFCFFRMHHAHGHLQLLWTWMLPLLPLALSGWLESPAVLRAARLTLVCLAAALASWYLAVFAALLGAVCLPCLAAGRRVTGRHALQALAFGLIALVTVGWFARPYFQLEAGPVAEAAANAADLRAYLVPPENTWPGQILGRHLGIETRWIWGERTLYVGAAVVTMTALGVVWLLQQPVSGTALRLAAGVLIAGSLALALSFGPTQSGLSPFDLLSRVPALALLRAPARFALLVMLAASLLCAAGAAEVRRRCPGSGPYVIAGLLALFFAESFVVDFPAGTPRPLEVPAVYRHLAALPDGPVLSLPSYRGTPEAFRESDYLLYSTAHWNRIVNGFGRQEPRAHDGRMRVLTTFPSSGSLELMRQLGVRYVVLHTRRASELISRADHAIALGTTEPSEAASVRLIHSTDGDFLFEVR